MLKPDRADGPRVGAAEPLLPACRLLPSMSFSFDRKYLVALAVSASAIVALGALGVQSTTRLRETLGEVSRAHEAQAVLADVEATLIDMQGSAHLYALTGQDDALAPFRAGAQALPQLLDRAEALIAPGADRLDLRAAALAKNDQLAQLVKQARQDRTAAAASLRAGAGEASMQRMRALLERLDAAERAHLAQREAVAAGVITRYNRLSLLLGVACVLLLVGIYAVMRAELRSRQRAHDAEQQAQAALQRQVADRSQAAQQATDALALSEARLRMIFETASEAILTIDDDQTIVMANAAAAHIFGYEPAELVGSSLDRLIPLRHRARHHRDVAGFGKAGEVRRVMGRTAEVHGVRADGTEFPAEAAISHASLQGHHLFTVVVRDITRRRQAERELRDSELRQRRLLELLPDAVLIDTGGRLTYVNAEAQRLFGASAAALIGQSPLEFVDPGSQPLARRHLAALQSGRYAQRGAELQILRFDGSRRTVESTTAAVVDHGETSVVMVLRDVTELRRMEAELAHSHENLQRLVASQHEVLETERRRIARELHDDLQQSLAAIKIDLAALAAQVDVRPGGEAALRSARGLADQAIESTRRIIGDLRPQILDDLGLVPALQLLASQFEQRTAIACALDADEDSLDGLLSPQASTALFRIVQEALNNAARHSRAQRVAIELNAEPPGLTLRVTDDGIGMPEPEQRRAGAVGLIGMHERARLLQGTLDVTPAMPHGTVVQVKVPVLTH
jgi:PAS domain S-box-containing protein